MTPKFLKLWGLEDVNPLKNEFLFSDRCTFVLRDFAFFLFLQTVLDNFHNILFWKLLNLKRIGLQLGNIVE